MPYYVIFGCTNGNKKISGIQLYQFPQNGKYQDKWISFVFIYCSIEVHMYKYIGSSNQTM